MGPLAGVKVVEFAGVGPGPICCMLLADLGATVLTIDRPEPSGLGIAKPPQFDLLFRGRKRIVLDLKSAEDIERSLTLIARADAIVEGFRPGVMERLGLGPDICLARNPRLIFGRMTGWGQDGPLAKAAGHDLNYIAVSGALSTFGRAGQLPAPPLNLVGDFGGALYLAFGIVAGILEARSSGQGQVVDAAMVETSAHMMTSDPRLARRRHVVARTRHQPASIPARSTMTASNAGTASSSRSRAIEPKFFAQMLAVLAIDPAVFPAQTDPNRRDEARGLLAEKFRTPHAR